MVPTTLISLTLSISLLVSADPYAGADCWTETEAGVAPQNVNLQLDLAPARSVAGGVLVPPDTARDILWRLGCLTYWPDTAQRKLNEQREVFEYRLEQEAALVGTVVQEVTPLPPDGIRFGNVVLLTAGGFVLGVGVGALVVLLAGG